MAVWMDRAMLFLSQVIGQVDFRRRLVVLTLHRVEEGSPIKAEHIQKHFDYLKKNYLVITPSQLNREIQANERRHLAMVVIDDCHHDTYQHIYPQAKAFGIPITIATPTDFFFRNQWLWFDKLYWLLAQRGRQGAYQAGGYQLDIDQPQSISGFKALLKSKLPPARDRILDELSAKMSVSFPGSPTPEYRPVALEEMKEMLASGLVEITAHSVSHPIVSLLSDADLDREIRQSKRELEEFTGTEIVSFCYPNGAIGDFDERTTKLVKLAGYQHAFVAIPGSNFINKLNGYSIKRLHIHPRLSVFCKNSCLLGALQRRLL